MTSMVNTWPYNMELATDIDWEPVHKYNVTTWTFPALQCTGFTDSWHIGTWTQRFYFSVKS